MTIKQIDRLSMYLAVLKVCIAYKSIWEVLPIAVKLFASFEDCVAQLQEAAEKQQSHTKGVSADKKSLREEVSDKALVVANAMAAYASVNNNRELEERIRYIRSDFATDREASVKAKLEIILKEAKSHSKMLKDYGIKVNQIEALEAGIKAFTEKLSSPKVAIDDRKQATAKIQEMINEIDDLLRNKFDLLFVQFKDTEFYGNYKTARKVVATRKKIVKSDKLSNPEENQN